MSIQTQQGGESPSLRSRCEAVYLSREILKSQVIGNSQTKRSPYPVKCPRAIQCDSLCLEVLYDSLFGE